MPKGFSDHEKEIIRRALLEKGRQLFEAYGLKKTNVEDLARAAGISKGAFYIFFDSKEELFMEILEQFEEDFRAQIFSHAFEPQADSRQQFADLLRRALLSWDNYPLLKQFDRQTFDYLVRKLPFERIQAHVNNDDAFVATFIDKWRAGGREMAHDPRTVSGLMKALFFVSLHKDDFGPDAYPGTMDTLIEAIAVYLVNSDE